MVVCYNIHDIDTKKVIVVSKEDFRNNNDLEGVTKNEIPGKIVQSGETSSFNKDDPRWKSGELEVIHNGVVSCKDENGKTYTVPKDEYNPVIHKSVLNGRVSVKDEYGNTSSVFKDDPRYLSGELVMVNKNKFTAVNPKTGEKLSIRTDDPRYLSGELVGHTSGSFGSNSIKYNILDRDGKVVNTAHGNFQKVCKENGYPYGSFFKAAKSQTPVFWKAKNKVTKNYIKYNGWRIVKVEK